MQAVTEPRAKPRDFGATGQPEAVSIEEAARLAGVGRSTIYEHLTGAREPRLESFKVGKRRLVRRAAVTRWLATLAKG